MGAAMSCTPLSGAFLELVKRAQFKSPASNVPTMAEGVRILGVENNFSPLIPQAIGYLPQLHTLLVRTDLRSEDEEVQDQLSGRVEELALRPQKPVKLKRLYIRQVRRWPRGTFNFVARCLQLQDWNLEVDDIDHPRPEGVGDTSSVKLRRLELHNASDVLGLLLRMPHTRPVLANLRHFTVTPFPDDTFEHPLSLLTSVRHSLEGFELNLGHIDKSVLYQKIPEILNLSTFTSLTHLVLINYPRSADQPPFALPQGITSLLSSYQHATASSLQTLTLTISWNIWNLETDWDEDGSWERTKQLVVDQDGKKLPAFCNLLSFRVRVSVHQYSKKAIADQSEVALRRAKELFDLGREIEGGVAFNMFKM
ncbi:hypothetical protein D9611_010206 [Ephemerocybe angulata]|uniref:Uncharacterized protein n=1 Tax=Ephemerocybe angulata TaxID=980116 RepID=A0A8H5AZ45_9AGAR|nr:hypothetical protein D9611_010206 [Tulosesus angulatus]